MAKQAHTQEHKPSIKPHGRKTKTPAGGTASGKAHPDGTAKWHTDPDTRRAMIAQAAYFRAEKRGFAAGGEEQDWLEAEAEIEALLERVV